MSVYLITRVQIICNKTDRNWKKNSKIIIGDYNTLSMNSGLSSFLYDQN